ncbi:MAG: SDR family NAD(P)-dependent oxidoreductase [Solirubrobacteraceae bacterium]
MTARLGLEGRCALVIDGASERGRACVRRLRSEDMTVAFPAGDDALGEAVASETGGSFLRCDHRDRASCDRAVKQALALGGGRLDVLVTNAAMSLPQSLEATADAVLCELLEVNLTATFRIARACFAPMRAQGGGSMIHLGSAAGIRADHQAAAYSIAAAGVIAIAELFAAEGAPDGVRSNAVCPLDDGSDVASLVVWLACDQAAQLSGATLRLDAAAGAAMVLDTRA